MTAPDRDQRDTAHAAPPPPGSPDGGRRRSSVWHVDGADGAGLQRRIDDAVLVIFTLVGESIGWATNALLDQDVERAAQVIADDKAIDERCEALIALIKERLAQAPADPVELENLVSVLQIVPELERSADLAEHIAQRAQRHLASAVSPKARGLIEQLSEKAIGMWRIAAQAYRRRSRDAAFELSATDDDLDELAAQLVSDAVLANLDPTAAAELALIARFYERLGDHAVNLARRIDAMAAPRRLSRLRQLTGTRSAAPAEPNAKRGLVRRALSSLSRFRVVPTDDGFFDLFVAAAVNARDCADEVNKLIVSFSDLPDHFENIKSFERRGDELTVELLRRLDASFVTPYDREDIHALTEEIDDVVDDIHAAADLLVLHGVDEALPEMRDIARILVRAAEANVQLIGKLPSLRNMDGDLEEIDRLESEADHVYRRSVARLFSGEYKAFAVLKWKDVVEALEGSVNAVENISDIVESIVLKHA